ncbi:MAG TPA: hypothetical protein VGY66_01210 [Gemmataceae bacterium]|nr:hypothetical protein [Gemmataceae bacterium]
MLPNRILSCRRDSDPADPEAGDPARSQPPDRLARPTEARQQRLEPAERLGVEAGESGGDKQKRVRALGLERRRPEVRGVDQQKGAGLTLVGKAPEQPRPEPGALQVGDDVPGVVEEVGAEGGAGAGPQRHDAEGAAAEPQQTQVQLQGVAVRPAGPEATVSSPGNTLGPPSQPMLRVGRAFSL